MSTLPFTQASSALLDRYRFPQCLLSVSWCSKVSQPKLKHLPTGCGPSVCALCSTPGWLLFAWLLVFYPNMHSIGQPKTQWKVYRGFLSLQNSLLIVCTPTPATSTPPAIIYVSSPPSARALWEKLGWFTDGPAPPAGPL